MPVYSVSLHHTLATAAFSLQELLDESHMSAFFFSYRWCASCFRCCLLSVAMPWTFHVHKAPGRLSLGSVSANPSHACARVSLQTGGLANPAVRISRAQIPVPTSTERQLCSVEVGEPAPKSAPVWFGWSNITCRLEDADREKFCKTWAIVARGCACLQWSSFGLADI